jgi:hypothetical protein
MKLFKQLILCLPILMTLLLFMYLLLSELLVVWVLFCTIHFNALRLHSLQMQGFGVPLDFNHLSYLVLSSKDEWDVAQCVAVYLSKHGAQKPAFSLKEEQHTFDLGRLIANATPEMVEIWNEEEKDALARIEGRWKEVLRKQEEVSTSVLLRPKIVSPFWRSFSWPFSSGT